MIKINSIKSGYIRSWNTFKYPHLNLRFDEIAKEKAKFISKQILHQNSLLQYFLGGNPGIEPRLKSAVLELNDQYERLICIVELLNFLASEEGQLKSNLTFSTRDPATVATGFNKLRYVLYSLAKSDTGYEFDKNAFSMSEVVSLKTQLDELLTALHQMTGRQDEMHAEFEKTRAQIASEFEDLKSLPALGKKSFYQLLFGKIAGFTGDKVADEILKALSPHILALLALQAPHLVEQLQRLI